MTRAYRSFLALLCVSTAVRLFMAARVPLSGDEAYYWLWSRHPAFGYYDHPPMVAWVIHLTTGLFGQTALACRLGAIVSLLCIPLVLARLTVKCGGTSDMAAVVGFLVLGTPYLVVESAFITPNSPFLLCWTLALWLYYRVLVAGEDGWADWLVAGLALGLAALAKLMALLMLPSLLLFVSISPPHRKMVRSVRAWGSLLAAALVFSPYVWWNAAHQWEDFRYQLLLRHLVPDAKYSGPLHFLMLQAFAISPVLLVVCALAVWSAFRRRGGTHLYLGSMAAVTVGFFALCSLSGQVELYWTMGGYLPAFICVAWWMLNPEDGRLVHASRRARIGLCVAILAPGLIITVPLYIASFWPRLALTVSTLHSPPGFRGNGVTELYSYPLLGQDLGARLGPHVFAVTDSYGLASVLSFYGPQYVHVMPGNLQGQEWRRWETPASLAGWDALYVDRQPLAERPDVRLRLQASFASLGPEDRLEYHQDGILTAVYWTVRCHTFKGSWP